MDKDGHNFSSEVLGNRITIIQKDNLPKSKSDLTMNEVSRGMFKQMLKNYLQDDFNLDSCP